MERCPLCGAKTSPKGFDVILTTDMLREIAKDVDIVASSHLGRQNIKSLLIASADEIERLRKVGSNMATTLADSAGKVGYGDTHHASISGASGQPQSILKDESPIFLGGTDLPDPEPTPPTEKEIAREMAPTPKGKKARK